MKTKRTEQGFSLVELSVALAILTAGMAAVGVMLLQSFQADRYNRSVRSAESVLRHFSEQFASGNPATLDATGNAVVRGNNIITATDTNPGTYYCSWTSTTYPTGSTLNRLDIVVGWGKDKSSSEKCERATPENCTRVMKMTNFY